jgi:hypothetical protein
VARAVRYMAGLPLDANVAPMTVMATKMPFIVATRACLQCHSSHSNTIAAMVTIAR